MISVQDQLAAVAQAEQQGKNEENRQRDALQAKRDQEAQQERQRQANAAAVAKQRAKAAAVAKQRAKAAAVAKQRAKAAEAERKARQAKLAAEAAQDKARDQSYKDELRRLEIQKQKLALAREEARVKRENEFIDQELKSKAAQTDVIQSHADANRNLSEGGHDLLQSEGKAREEKASGWFN
ncbi:DUF5384 family protein [Salmonella enterica]|nr:DUF5384 family protein [Salmonella enterica]EJT9911580.1 DUF5384 family protein [Salmonella enterica]EKA8115607.1 DUF5384 family protein [Salmonella enterica]